MHATSWTNHESIMTTERSHSQRTTWCVISLIWNIQNRHIYSNRKSTGLRMGWSIRSSCWWVWGFCLGWQKCSKIILWWWLYNDIPKYNTPKSTELCILNGWILDYVNYISIKLFKQDLHILGLSESIK